MSVLRSILLLYVLLSFSGPALAHEVRPAYLEISETAPSHFRILWKQPALGELALRLVPHLSTGWLDAPAERIAADPRHLIKLWQVQANPRRPLDGARVSIDGLDNSITDVLVRVTLSDGRSFDHILKPEAPTATIRFATAGTMAVPAYFMLGVEHILTGVDHLSFVLGLLLLIGLRWPLLKAITAFTAAHSLTLAASALGLMRAPAATVEALVALSILFLAVELVRAGRGERSIAQGRPWLVAFAFGLLHGFAFAGALRETGLPANAIPQAVLLFNLGVETGQLLFVAVAAVVLIVLRWIAQALPFAAPARLGAPLAHYALGTFAAYWLIERTALIFT